MATLRRCTILGCELKYKARGYCNAHYKEFIFVPNHPHYNAWRGMLNRCHNPNSPRYEYYGGRGIIVCDRWRYSYRTFVADIGLKPSPKHSIDRINNDGNYEPSNCRWATQTQQVLNQGLRSDNGTGVKGVYWDETYQRFHATLSMNGRRHHLGRYKTLPEAANARYLAEARYTV